ncbi:hypothetical protein HSEST_0223 [Halapricum desulfuricans]|uniref:Uncharacterized protein n=1 Tax=Halapricum desulfuricans TaxID=2841257 RepID=A0A897NQM6_9EURY|nr:hypothetical protein HSEST_0223 [Halapricum desulfuricans]
MSRRGFRARPDPPLCGLSWLFDRILGFPKTPTGFYVLGQPNRVCSDEDSSNRAV